MHDNLPRHFLSTLIRVAALLLRPARIVAVSHSTAKAFCGPISFQGIATIHNGADLQRFPMKSANAADHAPARDALGVPRDAFLICALGQICARKGQLELIRAFGMARALAPKLHLVIAGSVVFEHEKKYLDQLHRAAAEPQTAGGVHFPARCGTSPSFCRRPTFWC